MVIIGLDTALQNSALVAITDTGKVESSIKLYPKKQFKGHEDSLFQTHERIHNTARAIVEVIQSFRTKSVLDTRPLLAMEDYLITSRQRSHKIAELNAVLKEWCWSNYLPYCLVHPLKTKKFVIKKREVSKTEIIQYVDGCAPEVFKGHDRADYSDLADAYVIARIGLLCVQVKKLGMTVEQIKASQWETRWKELLLGETGILEKPGLLKWEY